jgi:hypothetical protein
VRDVRSRQFDLIGEVDRLPGSEMDTGLSMLLQTFTEGTYPTVAARVYACHPVVSDATDTEGESAALTVDTGVTIYAVNVGSAIPADGTVVVAAAVGGRVVFRHD